MKLQADPGHPLMQRGQDLAGLVLADAVDHRVICVPLEPDQRELPRQPGIAGYLGPESWILTSPQVSPSRTRLSKKQRRGRPAPRTPRTSARPLGGQAAGGE